MTLLDAARKMAENPPILGGSWVRSKGIGLCYYCEQWSDQPHTPDCPIDALPAIVAALEAAEQFVASSLDEPHDDEGAFEALVAALKGDT